MYNLCKAVRMSKRIAQDILIISRFQDKAFPWVEKGWLDRVTHLESKGVEKYPPFSLLN